MWYTEDMPDQQHPVAAHSVTDARREQLLDAMADASRCPGCDKRLADMGTFTARSRFGFGDLCAECGQREAFEGNFIAARVKERIAAKVANPRQR